MKCLYRFVVPQCVIQNEMRNEQFFFTILCVLGMVGTYEMQNSRGGGGGGGSG